MRLPLAEWLILSEVYTRVNEYIIRNIYDINTYNT